MSAAAGPSVWTRVADRLAHREPATALALFRIGVGLSVLYTVVPIRRSGVLPLVWMDRAYGGFRPLDVHHWLIRFVGGPTDASLMVLSGVAVLAGLLLVIGFGGRITALATGQLMLGLFAISPETSGGHDLLLSNALWLLVLSPSTATLSLDARLFGDDHAFFSPRPVAAWPRYVAIFQLVLVYTTTGMQKLGMEWMPWGHWTALYYALLTPSWQRYDTAWVPRLFPLTQVATALTWLWEVGSPLWLLAYWYRATRDRPGRLRALCNRLDLRAALAIFGILMHLGLWALMDLGPFSLVTLSFYACLWHPDEYARLWRRLRGLLRGLLRRP